MTNHAVATRPHVDAELISLGAALKWALKSERRQAAAIPPHFDVYAEGAAWAAASAPCIILAEAIDKLAAHSTEGRLVKAHAAAWIEG